MKANVLAAAIFSIGVRSTGAPDWGQCGGIGFTVHSDHMSHSLCYATSVHVGRLPLLLALRNSTSGDIDRVHIDIVFGHIHVDIVFGHIDDFGHINTLGRPSVRTMRRNLDGPDGLPKPKRLHLLEPLLLPMPPCWRIEAGKKSTGAPCLSQRLLTEHIDVKSPQ
ncbi:hypothetical protein FRB98_001807 [Tulasnella sp. 332]|nr:hypothetical protein FRB98_001807 [Tulasnella sp. 332]